MVKISFIITYVVVVFATTPIIAQEVDIRSKIEKSVKRIDHGKHMDCDLKYMKRKEKLIKRINYDEMVFYLENGSESIKVIMLEKLFRETNEPSKTIELIIGGYKNDIIFTCRNTSTILFFSYLSQYFVEYKDLKPAIYNLLIR